MYCFSCMKNACPFPAWHGINQFRTIFGGALFCRSSSKFARSLGDRPKNTTYWRISKQTCHHCCIDPGAFSSWQVSVSPAPLGPGSWGSLLIALSCLLLLHLSSQEHLQMSLGPGAAVLGAGEQGCIQHGPGSQEQRIRAGYQQLRKFLCEK